LKVLSHFRLRSFFVGLTIIPFCFSVADEESDDEAVDDENIKDLLPEKQKEKEKEREKEELYPHIQNVDDEWKSFLFFKRETVATLIDAQVRNLFRFGFRRFSFCKLSTFVVVVGFVC
jgi:hypothetical protein